jgi:hypothetical protein
MSTNKNFPMSGPPANSANGFWIDNVQQSIQVTADPLPPPPELVQWWFDWWQSFKAIDGVKLSKQLNRCAAANADQLYNKVLRGNKVGNALAGNAFAGLSQVVLGPDRTQGMPGVLDLANHGVLPQVITRTVGNSTVLGGSTLYSVPGTTVELGGQLRWATMSERYTAVAVKELPAFKSAFGVLEDVLDGKLLLDGATYISMEISCTMP